MPLSSKSLFHFTKNFENLRSILRTNFMPFYSVETLKFHDRRSKFAIPMICLCDIPLSQIKNHIKIYGGYGIGMRREWCIEKGFNPVFYFESSSKLSKSLTVTAVRPLEISGAFDINDPDRLNYDVIKYLKNYRGNFVYRGQLKKKDYKFYDEKEWRYVPLHPPSYQQVPNDSVYEDYNLDNKDLLEQQKLSFDAHDISYLIVNNSEEISQLIHEIKKMGDRFSKSEDEYLFSKIITREQIEDDF